MESSANCNLWDWLGISCDWYNMLFNQIKFFSGQELNCTQLFLFLFHTHVAPHITASTCGRKMGTPWPQIGLKGCLWGSHVLCRSPQWQWAAPALKLLTIIDSCIIRGEIREEGELCSMGGKSDPEMQRESKQGKETKILRGLWFN